MTETNKMKEMPVNSVPLKIPPFVVNDTRANSRKTFGLGFIPKIEV